LTNGDHVVNYHFTFESGVDFEVEKPAVFSFACSAVVPLERVLAKYPYIAVVAAPRFVSKGCAINFLSESLLSKISVICPDLGSIDAWCS
jgi:hypothetical protein